MNINVCLIVQQYRHYKPNYIFFLFTATNAQILKLTIKAALCTLFYTLLYLHVYMSITYFIKPFKLNPILKILLKEAIIREKLCSV